MSPREFFPFNVYKPPVSWPSNRLFGVGGNIRISLKHRPILVISDDFRLGPSSIAMAIWLTCWFVPACLPLSVDASPAFFFPSSLLQGFVITAQSPRPACEFLPFTTGISSSELPQITRSLLPIGLWLWLSLHPQRSYWCWGLDSMSRKNTSSVLLFWRNTLRTLIETAWSYFSRSIWFTLDLNVWGHSSFIFSKPMYEMGFQLEMLGRKYNTESKVEMRRASPIF